MNWYLKVLKQYFYFSGRARRKEFWMFMLFDAIFTTIALVLDNYLIGYTVCQAIGIGKFFGLGYGIIVIAYTVAVFIPGLAVRVRRLHDVDRSGWMLLVALIPIVGAIWIIVSWAIAGTPGENEYGINPKELDNAKNDTSPLTTALP